jgi:hypothetical protein
VKAVSFHRIKLLTEVMNNIMDVGRNPRRWKTARFILLRKPGEDPKLPNAYRPVSILPMPSKVWEKCLKRIMERCLGLDPFHVRQYGLYYNMDIKNAFNTLISDSIIEEAALEGRETGGRVPDWRRNCD